MSLFRNLGWRAARPTIQLVAVLLAFGCRQQAQPPKVPAGPGPSAPAAYGPSSVPASREIPRARPPATADAEWKEAPFSVLETDLSPAILVHSKGRHLNLFSDLKSQGLGAPSFLAWSTKDGPRTFARGATMDVSRMEEIWVLVWFSGAEGWTNWDSPWAVFLHHKPTSMRLDDAGLHLSFFETAGDVALMPLYGYFKPPAAGRDFLAEHGLPSKKIKTWEWTNGLPRDALTRLRYWAGATRAIPIYCEDSFSVDRSTDSVTIRSRFEYHSIRDDWNTKPIRLAPLSPPLGLAVKLGGFPVELSGKHFDFELTTPFGPYVAIPDADGFDASFRVLQYVNETEVIELPGTNASPISITTLNRLREATQQAFNGTPDVAAHRGTSEALTKVDADTGFYAKALPLLENMTRSKMAERLQASLRNSLHRANGSTPGADANSSMDKRRDGESGEKLFDPLWAYAHFTGDWQLIRQQWPVLKKLFAPLTEPRWVDFGRDATAVLGDQAAPPIAFARLAYKAGDIDSYNYGCYLFAQELVHVFIKQRGADYFRKEQPWHSMAFMGDEVFLTRLSDDATGWQLDGPNYPTNNSVRLFNDRWLRFNNADLGRFYRDYLKDDARREMNWLQSRWDPSRRWNNDPDGMPSLVQLRSLLLNESPPELAAVARPEQFSGPPAGIIASCLAILRTGQPTRYERLIPGGEPSPFVAGLEREVSVPNPHLVAAIRHKGTADNSNTGTSSWPQPTWPAWKIGAGAPWSFGAIKPVRVHDPSKVRTVPLNWNTRVTTFDLP